jgi:hypothetical protein
MVYLCSLSMNKSVFQFSCHHCMLTAGSLDHRAVNGAEAVHPGRRWLNKNSRRHIQTTGTSPLEL